MSLSVLSGFLATPSNFLFNPIDHQKTVLDNVRVFDGHRIREPGTIVIDGDKIGTNPHGAARKVDGFGAVLLPGFIDAHVHVKNITALEALRRYGVTTALDMGTFPYSSISSLQGLAGYPDLRGSGAPATVNGTLSSSVPGFPKESLIYTPEDAQNFVAARADEGVDYIKVIIDPLGPDIPSIKAIVEAAHDHRLKVISHAPSYGDVVVAEASKIDIITHVPLDKPLDAMSVAELISDRRIAVPTLAMMKGIANATHRQPAAFKTAASASVTALYRGGVPILAGTDANKNPLVAFQPPFGESIHEELELLVAAGLTNLDALRAATVFPARYFGLYDRGIIEEGRRADFFLVGGDPMKNISATRNILKVWCGGVEFTVKES